MYERLYGRTGILTIIGSGLMWAWFDAFYMSSLFPVIGSGMASEVSIGVTFACSIPFLVFALVRPAWVTGFLSRTAGIVCGGVSGTLGSLLLVLSDATGAVPLFVLGTMLCGLSMALMTVGWGAVYAQGGSITATPYVSGAFACAFVLDLPLLFMFPMASAVFYTLFPLSSCLVLRLVEPEDRAYASVLDSEVLVSPGRFPRTLRGFLGIPLAIMFGYALVMFGFGYLQHLISFSAVASGGGAHGLLVQVVRGAVAVVMFVVILRDLRFSHIVYRIGLPLMIAGCMTLPFTANNGLFTLSAAAIIAGYTAFDLFVWVIFSSIACTQSQSPMRTVAVMRITCAVGHVVGTSCAVGLVGFESSSATHLAEITTFVSYFIVIAVVLLLNSEEVFALSNGYFDFRTVVESLQRRFGHARAASGAAGAAGAAGVAGVGGVPGAGDGMFGGGAAEEGPAEEEASINDWLDIRFAELGLTARESEVARELTHGRTQKWIADYLCISENTVGTHLRRIYQKAGVHTRQQFLDVLAADSSASHDLRDIG